MRHSTALGGIALGGALAYGQTRHANQADATVFAERDWLADGIEQALLAGQPLPALGVPAAPKPRQRHGIVACYLVGMLASGAAVGVLIALVLSAVVLAARSSITGGQSKAGGVMAAILLSFVIGGIATVFPGMLIGLAVWVREQRASVKHDYAGARNRIYADHEAVRQALATGQTSPAQALAYVRGETATAPPGGLWPSTPQQGWAPPQEQPWGPPSQQQWGR